MKNRLRIIWIATEYFLILALLTSCGKEKEKSCSDMSSLIWNCTYGESDSIAFSFRGSAGLKNGEIFDAGGLKADILLPFADETGHPLTCWHFSASFDVKNPEKVSALEMYLRYDDGIRVFLNNVPVYSDNLTFPESGLADQANGEPVAENIKLAVELRPEGNTIEADLFQASPSSSDAFFSLKLAEAEDPFGTLQNADPELLVSKNGIIARFFADPPAGGNYYLMGGESQPIPFLREDRNDLVSWSVLLPDSDTEWYVSDGIRCGNPFSVKPPLEESDFSFVFLGDPQITGNTSRDAFRDALTHGKTDFALVAGDLVNSRKKISEYESAARAAGEASVPFASAPGNHDDRDLFDFFFFPENDHENSPDTCFSIGKTLFLILDSNELNYDVHERFIRGAVGDGGWEWIIAVLHHSIYSPCNSLDYDAEDRFAVFSGLFQKYGISLALSGDDHLYGRTGIIDGVLYLCASSSTGSKYYDAPDEKPEYLEIIGEEKRPTRTVIRVSSGRMEITSEYSDTDEIFDSVSLLSRTGKDDFRQEMLEKCKKKILSAVLPNGAVAVYSVHEGTNWINPYFGDYAAMALVRSGEYYHAKEYILWHFRHLNAAENDYNGLPYTIYDYYAHVTDGKVSEESTHTYDSVDSYAASFLILLDMYCSATGDNDLILEKRAFISGVIDALLSLDTGRAAVARPDSDVCYLMDNCEVICGLRAAQNLIEKVIIPAGHDNSTWNRLRNSVESFSSRISAYLDSGFKQPEGDYAWAETISGTQSLPDYSVFYPDSIAQICSIIYGIVDPNGQYGRYLYDSFCARWNWENLQQMEEGKSDTPWAMAAFCAAETGDDIRLNDFIDSFGIFLDNTENANTAELAWLVLSLCYSE